MDKSRIFEIGSGQEFNAMALEVFEYQFANSPVYREFCEYLNRVPGNVNSLEHIPFLPIEFFRSRRILDRSFEQAEICFSSSGTTGNKSSKHYVADKELYRKSFRSCFSLFYGDLRGYCILALLPSYLERQDSSLVFMVQDMILESQHPDSGFYLDNLEALAAKLSELQSQNSKILLLGVSFALLDLAEQLKTPLKNTIVMETGGMKGRRKEMIREELHQVLQDAWSLEHIHSEYGMTEMLSQAYSQKSGIFHCPPWMRILSRDTEDPLRILNPGQSGGINVIDLANLHSCSFIATQDLGKTDQEGGFEVLGRFDHSDIRGCNLMVI